jgi:hypothetical protein
MTDSLEAMPGKGGEQGREDRLLGTTSLSAIARRRGNRI